MTLYAVADFYVGILLVLKKTKILILAIKQLNAQNLLL